jgi:D-arabinose 1-dehydrogenase-like Zn-dependent alcohol dehydrogenase
MVSGELGWQQYAAISAHALTKHDRKHKPEHILGVLGITGLTAYFGMLDVGRPRPGETVLVSGAAGAVGSIAGQIAKINGCRVVGTTRGADKCRWIVDELGFDAAVDYTGENLDKALKAACPNGIDVYFDTRPLDAPANELYRSDAQKNAAVAARPSAERTACSFAQLSMTARVSGPACIGSSAMRRLLLGMMTNSVYGQFATRISAPRIQRPSLFSHQAAMPRRKPSIANGACIAKPRL